MEPFGYVLQLIKWHENIDLMDCTVFKCCPDSSEYLEIISHSLGSLQIHENSKKIPVDSCKHYQHKSDGHRLEAAQVQYSV